MPYPKETVWSEDFAPDERDQILTQVRLGEITPEEAEELARSKRLRPFATRPDYANHDPFKKPYWTLAMTLAWIVYRDRRKVKEWDNDFRQGWLEWRPQGSGHDLVPVKFADGKRFEEWGSFPDDLGRPAEKQQSDIIKAKSDLWAKLTEGTLPASGLSADQAEPIPIQPDSWLGIINRRTPETDSQEAFVFSSDHRRGVYREVRFPRKKVLGLWPQPPPRIALSVSLLKKEVIERMTGSTKPTKSELEAWAIEEGYSRASFREIYAKLPQECRYEVGESRGRKVAGVK